MENIIQIILKDMNKTNETMYKLAKKIKRTILILSISIILNTIAIIILNFWR